ncbi:hypothetical protein HALTITAN_0873 [Vreelandella titanicae BH1]|uniref:Uncharacterized protein n=1 Tax=Vreelandella titanicae BH1 TaxID=1204738 RepID=L9UC54_9GAMM|nr:hypothetical protein HALTITAN_0873 [Halomonas titanicae BH1]
MKSAQSSGLWVPSGSCRYSSAFAWRRRQSRYKPKRAFWHNNAARRACCPPFNASPIVMLPLIVQPFDTLTKGASSAGHRDKHARQHPQQKPAHAIHCRRPPRCDVRMHCLHAGSGSPVPGSRNSSALLRCWQAGHLGRS